MRIDDTDTKPELIAIAGQFAEFDEFTEAVAGWDIDFRQLRSGKLNATLTQVVGESWSLAKAHFDCPTYQQGLSVPGMRTFAILDPAAPDTDWCGRMFTPKILAMFARDTDFRSISPPGFDVYTLSFTEEQLAEASERLGIHDVTSKLERADATMQLHQGLAGVLRHLVNVSLNTAYSYAAQGAYWTTSNSMRDEIAEHLVLQLSGGSPLLLTPSQNVRKRAVNRALEIIEAGLEDRISIREVARLSGVGRRTLEYAFRDRFGVSPKAFVNIQRMILTRRDLRARPDKIPIADIANQWGYWHMGQFARDYRSLFGELPSESSRRR